MAGVSYRDKSAVFLVGIGADVPQATDLRGLYRLATNLARAKRNIVNMAVPLVQVGSPTIGSNDTAFSSGNRFTSGLVSSSSFTFAAVITKATPSANAGLIAAFSGGTAHDTLAVASTGQLRLYTESGTSNQQLNQSLAAVTDGTRVFVFGRCDGTNVQVGYVKAGAVTKSTAALTNARATTNTNALQVGGTLEGTFSGTSTMALAAIWGRSLADADLLEMVADWQSRYPDLAIV